MGGRHGREQSQNVPFGTMFIVHPSDSGPCSYFFAAFGRELGVLVSIALLSKLQVGAVPMV